MATMPHTWAAGLCSGLRTVSASTWFGWLAPQSKQSPQYTSTTCNSVLQPRVSRAIEACRRSRWESQWPKVLAIWVVILIWHRMFLLTFHQNDPISDLTRSHSYRNVHWTTKRAEFALGCFSSLSWIYWALCQLSPSSASKPLVTL